MIYLFLANGFEEVEALAPLDILRRAGAEVTTVSVGTANKTVKGAHGIKVEADLRDVKMTFDDIDALILPGGMPGAANLDASKTVDLALAAAQEKGAILAAICAAPMVLGKRGYLKGKRAVCFPGFENELAGAIIPQGERVVRDGNVITAVGMGAALEFGLELTAALFGADTANGLAASAKIRL